MLDVMQIWKFHIFCIEITETSQIQNSRNVITEANGVSEIQLRQMDISIA